MGDLISREAVVEALRVRGGELLKPGTSMASVAVYGCVDIVKDVPAVDAVEVVRCKDCAHARALPEDRKPYFADDIMVCALGRGDPNKGQSVVWLDDFCSDGVKMDKEGEK